MKKIKCKIVAKAATKDLEEEIQDELQIEDPSVEKAVAIINESKRNSRNINSNNTKDNKKT